MVIHRVYAVLTIAQIILGLRADIPQRAQADLEEVSLDLMIRWIPRFARDGEDPVQANAERGRQAKIIRPVHPPQRFLPALALHDYSPLPDGLLLIRTPRYAGKDKSESMGQTRPYRDHACASRK